MLIRPLQQKALYHDSPPSTREESDEVVAAVDGGSLPATADEPHAMHLLPALLVGCDVAAARLIIATLELALSGADVRTVASV